MKATIVFLNSGEGHKSFEESRALLETVATSCGHQFTFEDVPLTAKTAKAKCRKADAIIARGPRTKAAKEAFKALTQALGLSTQVEQPLDVRTERMRGAEVLLVTESEGAANVTSVLETAFKLALYHFGHMSVMAGWAGAQAAEMSKRYPGVTVSHPELAWTSRRLAAGSRGLEVIVAERSGADALSREIRSRSVLGGSRVVALMGKDRQGLYVPFEEEGTFLSSALSVAMLLRFSLGLEREATLVESALASWVVRGVSAQGLGKAVRDNLADSLPRSLAV